MNTGVPMGRPSYPDGRIYSAFLNGGALLTSNPFDICRYTCYTLPMTEEAKMPRNIRIRPTILHQARIAAVIQKKTLGQWLEDAILEKIDREQELNREGRG